LGGDRSWVTSYSLASYRSELATGIGRQKITTVDGSGAFVDSDGQ